MNWHPYPPGRPHPENAPGDFYVEDGCCIFCGMPELEAPEIFGWAKSNTSCVVVKQPGTAQEIDHMISAMWAADLECIRYRGSDPAVGRRIVEAGLGALCERPPPDDAKPLHRSHVLFKREDAGARVAASTLAEEFLAGKLGVARGGGMAAIRGGDPRHVLAYRRTMAKRSTGAVDRAVKKTGAASLRVPPRPSFGSGSPALRQIIPVRVHHLVPGRHEVLHELPL